MRAEKTWSIMQKKKKKKDWGEDVDFWWCGARDWGLLCKGGSEGPCLGEVPWHKKRKRKKKKELMLMKKGHLLRMTKYKKVTWW